jgi:biotin transport system substrate-specific component
MAQIAEPSLYRPRVVPAPAISALTVVAGSLFIALCAHIAIPLFFTPVPMTLQPFAVLLVGLLLGPGMGAATCATYLMEGAAGLPVFTPQGAGGLLQLLGPTGGYLLSYPAAAAIAGALSRLRPAATGRRGQAMSLLGLSLLGAGAANLLILSAGACWLALLTHQAAATVSRVAVTPFLAGDALKVVLAALIAAGWQRARYRFRFDQAHTPEGL